MSEPAVTIATGELLPAGVTAVGTHRRLLTTAVELFAERGYHGVSVRHLASAMGVRPSSLYAHYASKEELFSVLVFTANDLIHQTLVTALMESGTSPAEQLSLLVHRYVTFHAEYPLLATIGHNDLHVLTGDALRRVSRTRRDSSNLLRAVIERGNDSGEFACTQPWLTVAAIAGMGIRLATWYRAPGHEADIEGSAAEAHDWVPEYDMATVGDTFAQFALDMVRYSPNGRAHTHQPSP